MSLNIAISSKREASGTTRLLKVTEVWETWAHLKHKPLNASSLELYPRQEVRITHSTFVDNSLEVRNFRNQLFFFLISSISKYHWGIILLFFKAFFKMPDLAHFQAHFLSYFHSHYHHHQKNRFSICLVLFETGSCYVAQVGLELLILLQTWATHPALVRFYNHPRLWNIQGL